MRSRTSIGILLLAGIAVFLLFSSQAMKGEEDVLLYHFSWKSPFSLDIAGANYPDDLHGLPILSYRLDDDVSEVEIVASSRSPYPMTLHPEETQSQLVSLRKLWDKGTSVTFLDIIPVQYDSVAGQYHRLEDLQVRLKKRSKKKNNSSARTGSSNGNSVLSEGDWYKIPVLSNGVYKIDYEYLNKTGIDIRTADPRKIRIFGNGGGMLPQQNSEDRPVDLQENAIYVQGEEDGSFDQTDYILFYGQGPDEISLDMEGTLHYQKNFYTDSSYYFLTVSGEEGLRIETNENLGADHPKITSYDDYLAYEKDEVNIINSGREWFGEKFDFTLTYDLNLEFQGLTPNTVLQIESSILGQSLADASLDLSINGTLVGSQDIFAITEGTYVAKGSLQKKDFQINTDEISADEDFTVRLSFNPAGSNSKGHLNYLKLLGKRNLKLYNGQTHFRSLESAEHAIATFEIEDAQDAHMVWRISDALRPENQSFSIAGSRVTFGALSGALEEYIVFKDSEYLIPEIGRAISNQNLRGLPNSDLLIVSHPEFLSQAERLASFRESHDGLSVSVVTTDQVYNEFSSGKLDVSAIRDFIRHIYQKGANGNRLENVLLFGKGTFDYRDRIDNNSLFVPIYTSRNSVHPINSYSSDDFFGFLDDDEGEWSESYIGDHLMDVGIGRIPVKSSDEARIVVNKLINYASNSNAYGPWRNEIVFVADDGDRNLHQRDADKLATLIDTAFTSFNTNKIYVDAFEQTETSIGESAPEVNKELKTKIEDGTLIVNFTGHGSATRWTSETILNITSISELENNQRLPLFVTATCEFGRHDNPKAISGAEYLLLNDKGGAIGLVTTSRPVFSSTNFVLNKAFYQNVFLKTENQFMTLGEVFRNTKNQSLNGSVNRNFSLMGDPSMKLAYPKESIRIIADEESFQQGDTLKALGTIKLRGQIVGTDAKVNRSFNGSLLATVFDKAREVETFGFEDSKMRFLSRDNVLFRGEVSVANGEFEIEFIMPKNINYEFDKGKISMYAMDLDRMQDAAGSDLEFVIGGQDEEYEVDNDPPLIDLYVNDTSFVAGGVTGPNIKLVARLQDESGISTSFDDQGRELTMILDDSLEVSVGRYYMAARDSYQLGWVTFPIDDLSIGAHTIRLLAWDVHNNFSESSIDFFVIDDEHISITGLRNYPNPFKEQTRIVFEHNRAGDDLQVDMDIISSTGSLVKRIAYNIENSPSRVSEIEWNLKEQNGSNVIGGLYILRLSVRSLSDGSKNVANHKLVIIN